MRFFSITIQAPSGTILLKTDGFLPLSRIFATEGFLLPLACGGTGRCGKCRVRLISGIVIGDVPDEHHTVRACLAYPGSDLTVVLPDEIQRQSVSEKSSPLAEIQIEQTISEVPKDASVGLAFDIGTTTLVASLVATNKGDSPASLAVATALNPQTHYGADVLSRVAAADEHLSDLKEMVLHALESLASELLNCVDASPDRVIFTGNTVMLHLLCGVSPHSIGQYPYTPVFRESRTLGHEFGKIPRENTFVLPTASGFIGADLLSALLAWTEHSPVEGSPILLIDLGTNCEAALILPQKDKSPHIYATSAAAGPAMEGGNLSCGMPALSGAIRHASFDGYLLTLETVGGFPPRGICGSALFDLIALLRRYGAIDRDGTLLDEEIPASLSERMTVLATGETAFSLENKVFLSQNDIRAFQLAKSAVFCAINALLSTAGISSEEIGAVAVAGAFGTHINYKSAEAVGLFPRSLAKKTVSIGNAALRGAELCLFSEEYRARLQELANAVQIIDLERTEGFETAFLSALPFP